MRCASVGAGVRNALRDLLGRQAADLAQRQRDLRVGRQRRMAAGEDQPEPIVLDALRHRPTPSGSSAAISRAPRPHRRAASKRARRRRPSIALNRPADTSQARGLAGTPSRGHCSRAAAERVVQRFLGDIEVAEQPNQGRQDAARLRAVDGVHRFVDMVRRGHDLRSKHRVACGASVCNGFYGFHGFAGFDRCAFHGSTGSGSLRVAGFSRPLTTSPNRRTRRTRSVSSVERAPVEPQNLSNP